MPEPLDRVHFDVGGRQVEVPWDVGEELKTRALKASSTQSIATKMMAVGTTSKPIEVADAGEMLAFIELLDHWSRGTGDNVPASVRELRGALRDALHNRQRGA